LASFQGGEKKRKLRDQLMLRGIKHGPDPPGSGIGDHSMKFGGKLPKICGFYTPQNHFKTIVLSQQGTHRVKWKGLFQRKSKGCVMFGALQKKRTMAFVPKNNR